MSLCTHAQECSYTYVERPEIEIESLPLTLYTLSFEEGSLIESRVHCLATLAAQGPPEILLSICTPDTLPTKPYLQPGDWQFHWFKLTQ